MDHQDDPYRQSHQRPQDGAAASQWPAYASAAAASSGVPMPYNQNTRGPYNDGQAAGHHNPNAYSNPQHQSMYPLPPPPPPNHYDPNVSMLYGQQQQHYPLPPPAGNH